MDQQESQQAFQTSKSNNQAAEYAVDQWFDIDSAAGSPTNPEDPMGHRSYNLTHRPALGFGTGFFESGTPMTKADALNQQAKQNGQKTVSGPQVEKAWNNHAGAPTSTYRPIFMPILSGSPHVSVENPEHSTLHISTLPRTQRVETQMHVTLTLPTLPPKIKSIRFQKYALARQKLLKKDSKSSPSTLELYAHCVCDTAMRDPAKRRQAFRRAALAANREGSAETHKGPEGTNDFPEEPLEGGFVSICKDVMVQSTAQN